MNHPFFQPASVEKRTFPFKHIRNDLYKTDQISVNIVIIIIVKEPFYWCLPYRAVYHLFCFKFNN